MNDAMKLAAMSVLRSVLITLGGVAVAKGYLTNTGLEQVVGAVIVIVTAAWGAFDKMPKKGAK